MRMQRLDPRIGNLHLTALQALYACLHGFPKAGLGPQDL